MNKSSETPDSIARCVICDRESKIEFFEKHGIYTIYECPLCSGQFVNPMKGPDYDLLYKTRETDGLTYEKHTYFSPEKYVAIYKSLAYVRCVLDLLKKYNLSGKLLDVGCSQGAFAKIATDLGFDVYAIDPSEEAIQYAQQNYGLGNAYCRSLNDIPDNLDNFNVIVAMEVVEHLENPRSLFAKTFDLLVPGGHLILTTPNNRSFEVRYHRRPVGDYPPHHLSRYCIDTMKYLLNNSGFEHASVFTNPVDRFAFGNVFFPALMPRLALDKEMAMPICSLPEIKKTRLSSTLIKHPAILRIFQIAGDAVSIPFRLMYPHGGAAIIAIARKPQ